MPDWASLSHVRWECRNRVVITPDYRKRTAYGRGRRHARAIQPETRGRIGLKMLERHSMHATPTYRPQRGLPDVESPLGGAFLMPRPMGVDLYFLPLASYFYSFHSSRCPSASSRVRSRP